MHLRTFQLADASAVIGLWRRCELVRPWNNPQLDIERKRRVDPELFLVGEVDGVLIASVMGGYEGHRGVINYLAVDPAHRGKGYGAQLMQRIEQMLIARGCPKINLLVRSDNANVIKFYESIGYKQDAVVSLGKRLIAD